jgi:hypothetical protein
VEKGVPAIKAYLDAHKSNFYIDPKNTIQAAINATVMANQVNEHTTRSAEGADAATVEWFKNNAYNATEISPPTLMQNLAISWKFIKQP